MSIEASKLQEPVCKMERQEEEEKEKGEEMEEDVSLSTHLCVERPCASIDIKRFFN